MGMTRPWSYLLLVIFMTIGCAGKQDQAESPLLSMNWQNRSIALDRIDSLYTGSSYLSTYSEIYERNEFRTHKLTATISMKNISSEDSVFITRADYYNTKGEMIRSYLDDPIYIEPLETIEIVIAQEDRQGGTGANFIFEWATKNRENEPLFEAIMISTSGQQGISFTTQGIKREGPELISK